MNTRIIVDSTTDLMPEVKGRVSVVPLTVHFGDEEYIDGVTIDHKSFYEKLVETDVHPTTSQATPAAFMAEYEKVRAAGDSAVVITLSAKLSGTYQSAVIAAADFENIYVVDSASATIGAAVLTELALRYLDEGLEAKEIAARLEEEKKRILIVALLDTLEYLKRGGRISKTAAFAGAVLNIKPVIAVSDGEIMVLGKARGSKMGNNLLEQEIEKAGGVDFSAPVMLGYTGLSDLLLRKYIEDSRRLWEEGLDEVRFTTIGSVIGTHAGPGAIAVAFFNFQKVIKAKRRDKSFCLSRRFALQAKPPAAYSISRRVLPFSAAVFIFFSAAAGARCVSLGCPCTCLRGADIFKQGQLPGWYFPCCPPLLPHTKQFVRRIASVGMFVCIVVQFLKQGGKLRQIPLFFPCQSLIDHERQDLLNRRVNNDDALNTATVFRRA